MEDLNVSPEVVSPEADATPEVVTPENDAVVTENPEVVNQDKKQTPEMDAWFAEKRRELEDDKRKMLAEIDGIRKSTTQFQSDYEEQAELNRLKDVAEQTGFDYDTLVQSYRDSKEIETTMTNLSTENETLKSENEELKARLQEIDADADIERMYAQDREILQKIDPNINIDELGQDFFELRMKGLDTQKAYFATKGISEAVTPPPVMGKVADSHVDPDFITEEAWDAMPDSQRKKIMKENFNLVWSSQQKWLKK